MVLYIIRSQSDWNTTAGNTINPGDIVRMDASFTVTTSTLTPLNMGAGLFNGARFTLTVVPDSVATGIFTIAGGTVTNLNVAVSSSTNTWTSILLTDASYGTVSKVSITGGTTTSSATAVGVVIATMTNTAGTLTLSRVSATGVTMSTTNGFRGLVSRTNAGTTLVVDRCLLSGAVMCLIGNVLGASLTVSKSVLTSSAGSTLCSFINTVASTIVASVTECYAFGVRYFFSTISINNIGTTKTFSDCYVGANGTFTKCFVQGVDFITTFTRCGLLSSLNDNTAFFALTVTSGMTISNCFGPLSTLSATNGGRFASLSSGSVTGTLTDSATITAAATLSTSFWSDNATNFPLLTAIADATEFAGYTSASASAVTRVSLLTFTFFNDGGGSTAPTASNLSAAETYLRNTDLNLTDIVVTDVDSSVVTVTLTLANPLAGSFNTATASTGASPVTSTYVSGTGTWTASGDITSVNTLLAGLTFTPALDSTISPVNITTSVTDGYTTAATGTKVLTFSAGAGGNVPICFTAGTRIRLANGLTAAVETIAPASLLMSAADPTKQVKVRTVSKHRASELVRFAPFSLSPQQDKPLVVSSRHLVYNAFTNTWAQARAMPCGAEILTKKPVTVYHLHARDWETVLANNVPCETAATTPLQRVQRQRFVSKQAAQSNEHTKARLLASS